MILVHIGSCPKWTICALPGAPVWVDSRSGIPITALFLIRQEITKYWRNPGGMKFDPLHFGQFNLCLDQFFEEIMDLNTEIPILNRSTCYNQNGDWGTRRGSGDLLWIGSFNFYLDSFFEEILNLDREIRLVVGNAHQIGMLLAFVCMPSQPPILWPRLKGTISELHRSSLAIFWV